MNPIDTFVGELRELFSGEVGNSYPRHLQVLIGHPMVYAWYLATARLLLRVGGGDEARREQLVRLWECALTCTVRVCVGASLEDLAVAAMHQSEAFGDYEKMADTFLSWALKCGVVESQLGASGSAQNIADLLSKCKVRYQGKAVSKAMVLTAQSLRQISSTGVSVALQRIEDEFGRVIISTSYNKISRLTSAVKTMVHVVGSPSSAALLQFVVEMMLVNMRREDVSKGFFTLQHLDKGKNGQAGYIHMQAAKFAVLTYLFRISENLVAEEHALLHAALQKQFLTPMAYHQHFPPDAADSLESTDGAFASKLGIQLRELFRALYAGDHDVELKALGGSQNPWAILSSSMSTAPTKDTCEEVKMPELTDAIKHILHLASTVSVPAAGSGEAPVAFRSLLRKQQRW